MTVTDIIAARGITEILHFTTHLGLTGILDASMVRSRTRLRDDQRLEFILKLNTPKVMDTQWEDFVNLSISRVNNTLFGIASNRWHPDMSWRILSFDPEILTHNGVWFSSTNNAYHQHTFRGQGADGLTKLFNQSVPGRYGALSRRNANTPDCHSTCPQAEVLYPGELSTGYLRRIYVQTPEDHDDVHGQLAQFGHRQVQVIVDMSKFE